MNKYSLTLWDLQPLEMSLIMRKMEKAVKILKTCRLHVRVKTMRMLNKLYVYPSRYVLEKEQYELIPELVKLILSECEYHMFEDLDTKRFRAGKDYCWWKLVNRHKVWKLEKSTSFLRRFPKSFKGDKHVIFFFFSHMSLDTVFVSLLCFKRISKGLLYPIPLPIQHRVFEYLSILTFNSQFMDIKNDEDYEKATGAGEYLDTFPEDEEAQDEVQELENNQLDDVSIESSSGDQKPSIFVFFTKNLKN